MMMRFRSRSFAWSAVFVLCLVSLVLAWSGREDAGDEHPVDCEGAVDQPVFAVNAKSVYLAARQMHRRHCHGKPGLVGLTGQRRFHTERSFLAVARRGFGSGIHNGHR